MRLFLLFLLLPGLLPLGLSVRSASGTNVRISVTNGAGSGEFPAGETVYLLAAPNPDGKVFDRWIGDVEGLDDPSAAQTTLKLPDRDLALTATYKDAPAWTPKLETIENRRVFSFFPTDAVGVILFFHGSGGSAAAWIDARQGAENRLFLDDAVAQGFGIVVTESADRVNRQWSPRPPDSNPDIRFVNLILEMLRKRGDLTKATPVFGVGMSNGGGFVSRVSAVLGFQGQAIYCASGVNAYMARTTVPTIWCVARNDENVDNNKDAEANFQQLASREVAAEFLVSEPSPVYPSRFQRIPGITTENALDIHDRLKAGGFLNDGDFLIEDPARSDWEHVLEPYRRAQGAIDDQLSVCYARHKFFSTYNSRVLRFFGARITPPANSLEIK